MERTSFLANPYFVRYVKHLLELHRLIAQGKCDEPEADAVRDQMDVPWKHLSVEEIAVIDGLSADLYTIGANEAPLAAMADRTIPVEFKSAVETGDWHTVLRILREFKDRFTAAQAAFVRGVCWARWGLPDVAIAFFEEKARLEVMQPDEEIWLLTCLIQAKRIGDAMQRAEAIRQNAAHPLLLMTAAHVFSLRAAELDDGAVESLRRQAIETAERGLRLSKTLPDDAMLSVQKVTTLVHLAMDYEALKEKARALEYCSEALRLDPNNANALMLYGWLNLERDPQMAHGQFQRGLSRGLVPGADAVALIPMTAVSSN